jgi:hypothetical protein
MSRSAPVRRLNSMVEVPRGAERGDRDVPVARTRLRRRHHLGHRPLRAAPADDHDERRAGGAGHHLQVALRVEIRALQHERHHRRVEGCDSTSASRADNHASTGQISRALS